MYARVFAHECLMAESRAFKKKCLCSRKMRASIPCMVRQ
jgi:hypothetical protein